jgi:hydroxymethylbilane synthase
MTEPFIIATRGSALALAQANQVLAQCKGAFPEREFQIQIIKTTGDKLQTASMSNLVDGSVKGLFTKELEAALLERTADIAVHSLKDLPTDLPDNLILGAVCERVDPRDVMIWRGKTDRVAGDTAQGLASDLTIRSLPPKATVATSSTRRKAQLLAIRPDLNIVPIRGNVPTRLQKLSDNPEIDALILAAAGLHRLGYKLAAENRLVSPTLSAGDTGSLHASCLAFDEMLPCVGQAAVGIEIHKDNQQALEVCRQLNHPPSFTCVAAERAFLHAMGGGCQSPVAAHAVLDNNQIRLRAVSFRSLPERAAELSGPAEEAVSIGESMARKLL